MQTWYYTTVHLEALQASFLSETNVYLGYARYFWRSSWNWHQDYPPPPHPPQQTKTETQFQHQKRIRRPKISGIRGITLVSVSH